MTKTTVVNCKEEKYDIFIGRPSKWGNPYVIGKDGSRKEVITKYKNWLIKNEELMSSLDDLKGLRLGCFCKPKDCHGDILCELINSPKLPFL